MTDITVVGAGGEYMESVVVVAWHKKPGDLVKAGDLVVTVETAKAATEIEAPASGVLGDIRAQVGEEVAVGTVLGTVRDADAEAARPSPPAPASPQASSAPVLPAAAAPAPSIAELKPAVVEDTRIKASPLARRVAASLGIDLRSLSPSSPTGRIKLRDVNDFAAAATAAVIRPAPPATPVGLTRRGSGEGLPFVFLHGFGADALSWQPLLAAMGPATPVVLVDLPGHGRSAAPVGTGSVENLAFAVARALDEAGIAECHLVGHSLGGAVAIALAETGRLGPRSMTLIAPAGLGPDIDGDFLKGYCRATRPESLKPWLLRLFADGSVVTSGYVQAALKARSEALRQAQTDLAESLFPEGTQAAEMRSALRRIMVPQKIIWGESDRIIPMRHALGVGPEAAIHLLPNVGHMPHVEASATVARLILQNARSAG